MADTTNKVVTLGTLSTFKLKMDQEVDKKLQAAGVTTPTYATDADIEALFAENTGV